MAPTGSSIELKKRDVRAGAILWLRNNTNTRDPEAFQRSGLDRGALGHPVMVINTLAFRHPFIWICMVRCFSPLPSFANAPQIRGTYKAWRRDISILETFSRTGNNRCGECRTHHLITRGNTTNPNAIGLEGDHAPERHRHLAAGEVFEVSLAMMIKFQEIALRSPITS